MTIGVFLVEEVNPSSYKYTFQKRIVGPSAPSIGAVDPIPPLRGLDFNLDHRNGTGGFRHGARQDGVTLVCRTSMPLCRRYWGNRSGGHQRGRPVGKRPQMCLHLVALPPIPVKVVCTWLRVWSHYYMPVWQLRLGLNPICV